MFFFSRTENYYEDWKDKRRWKKKKRNAASPPSGEGKKMLARIREKLLLMHVGVKASFQKKNVNSNQIPHEIEPAVKGI